MSLPTTYHDVAQVYTTLSHHMLDAIGGVNAAKLSTVLIRGVLNERKKKKWFQNLVFSKEPADSTFFTHVFPIVQP